MNIYYYIIAIHVYFELGIFDQNAALQLLL